MNAIYLIDVAKNQIVGRYDDVETAAIAGELHLADGYYVGNADDLLKQRREMLRKILAALGEEVKGNRNKAYFVDRIETVAGATQFAPLVKEESTPVEEPKQAPIVKRWKRPQKDGVTRQMWALCDEMSGQPRKDVLAEAAVRGLNPNMAKTQYQRWTRRYEGE
jgi:hypothetical protein